MHSKFDQHEREHLDRVFLYAVRTLPSGEVAAVEAHFAECGDCLKEFESLKPIVASLVYWPTDVLRPSGSLWDRLAQRILTDSGITPVQQPVQPLARAEWEEVAAGISVVLLATDK